MNLNLVKSCPLRSLALRKRMLPADRARDELLVVHLVSLKNDAALLHLGLRWALGFGLSFRVPRDSNIPSLRNIP